MRTSEHGLHQPVLRWPEAVLHVRRAQRIGRVSPDRALINRIRADQTRGPVKATMAAMAD